MPRVNQVPSLRKLCLVSITYHWDLVGYSCNSPREMSDMIENSTYADIQGPFTTMPSALLEDLLQAISEKRTLSRKHLHLLCQEQLRSLNLGFGTCGEIFYAFQFMQRTQKLEKLNLAYQIDIAPSNLLALIPTFARLKSLNLQMTTAVDKTLELIGIYCPNITELILTQTLVSDSGIRMMCEAQQKGVLKCPKLKRLAINETQVTWVGAYIAVHNLPELSEFEFDRIFQVFQCLDNQAIANPKQLKLKSLVSCTSTILDDSIGTAALMCPDVEILSISNALIFNETLYKFMQFEKLHSITIVNHEDMTLNFEEGILPLLQICGGILENLILDNFTSIDLISLGKLCPKIRKLGLSRIAEYRLNSSGGEPISGLFSNLCALELWLDSKTEFVSSSILIQLLHSCTKVTDLLVKKYANCDQHTFEKIWKTNPMRRLNRLTFDECQQVDLCLLDALLRMENDLSVIRIWTCPEVTRNAKEMLLQHIDEHNLDVYFQWVQ